MTGRILSFQRGFGFIEPLDRTGDESNIAAHQNVFFFRTAIAGYKDLLVGDKVTYILDAPTDKGPRASMVRLFED